MRRILTFCTVIVLFALAGVYRIDGIGVVQEATPTPITLPEGYLVEAPRTFPSSTLFCEDAINLIEGATWNGITIGLSDRLELLNILGEIGSYSIRESDNNIVATVESEELFRLEPNISACIHEDIVTVLGLSYRRGLKNALRWDTFLSQYGEPDAVTWYQGVNGIRVLFWFEQGIALEVSILGDSSNGLVLSTIYFSPIEGDDYTNQYPYNRTWFPDTPELEDIYGEQNPFDFDAIIATITAEPSRTPTPTFPPRATTTESPSATPTP